MAREDSRQVAGDMVVEPQQPRQILHSSDARRVSTLIPSIPFPHVPVGGRLIHFIPQWQQITTDLWVLEIIGAGYALEFVQNPPPFLGIRKTKVSNLTQLSIMQKEVNSLLEKNAVRLVPTEEAQEGFYSTMFLVPKKNSMK